MKRKILYIGNFKLPDKNAAAHRVINIAKILREIGYEVTFYGVGEKNSLHKPYYVDGFPYVNYFCNKKSEHLHQEYDVRHIIRYINENKDTKAIIAYNYPTLALWYLSYICKKRKIALIADCTEWYDRSYGFLRAFESDVRMKYVHKHLNGVICISKFLLDFYEESVPSVMLPPLVDINSDQYVQALDRVNSKHNEVPKVIIYTGTPSAAKESLDVIVQEVGGFKKEKLLLNVVGITKDEFKAMYLLSGDYENVHFFGRVDHHDALRMVAESDYALIIRPESRLTRAGFPTKFVEAISCGTPVISNKNSNVSDYLQDGVNGFLVDNCGLREVLEYITNTSAQLSVDRTIFDYRRYVEQMTIFLNRVGVE